MMDDSYQHLVHPKVQNLSPYVPGKSIQEIQDKYFLNDVIKLASNENPLGCSPKVLEAIQTLDMNKISLYPSTYQHPLIQQLANFLNIPKECLYLGPGSDAIFNLLIQAYALPLDKTILTHQYAFMGYEIQAATFGLNTIKVPINSDNWQLFPEDLIGHAQPNIALIFIANPNNPTGQILEWQHIITILKHIPKNCLLVIDEAYYEYSDLKTPALKTLIQDYPNLVVTRTFSKAYGLASLRLGYAIAHADVIATLKKIQLPFTVNQVALEAGLAALNDQDFIQKTQTLNQTEKTYLVQELQQFPFKIHPTRCNFITFEYTDEVSHMITYLESQGMILRGLQGFGLPHAIRATIGTHAQNTQLIQLLNTYLSKD